MLAAADSWVPIAIIGVAAYFAPAIVAQVREHRSSLAIGALNLLLGWTLLGWVAALVWALTDPGPRAAVIEDPEMIVITGAKPAPSPIDPTWTGTCGACRSRIHPQAKVCPHCRSRIEDDWASRLS